MVFWNGDSTPDFVSKFRDLKIRMISGEDLFKIKKEEINKHKKLLNFISNELSNDIISGSISLSLYGLINRDIGDIDVLIKDIDRYDSYYLSRYGEDDIPNRLGYKTIKYKPSFFKRTESHDVDFFEDKGAHFEEFNFNGVNLKVHHPIEVISHKIEMIKNNRTNSSTKHSDDLYGIFRSINFEN